MRIALVRPNMSAVRSSDAMEPLALGILSALTPAAHARVLVDERVEPLPAAIEADLAALTVETYTARRAYAIAADLRRRGIPVVMGGHHPTLAPDEALAHADAVVVGDAEGVWPEVVEDAARGALKRVYHGRTDLPLAGVRVDRALFAGKPYLRRPMVQFGRGCRHACDFCSIRAYYGADVRHRPVGEVLAEIAALPGRGFLFADDNLFGDRDATLELLRGLRGMGKRWGAQLGIDAARDEGMLELLAAAGCTAVLVGFESLDPGSLRDMRKGWNGTVAEYESCIRCLRRRGIMVYGTFVFGYDADGPASFDGAVEFALRNGLFLANFNPLTPTPGTPLLARLRAERRLIGDPWWLDPGFRYGGPMFHPAGMTAEQLAEGCLRARRTFYAWRSIGRRALDRSANARNVGNLSLYLLGNLVSRREIARKQGRALG